MSKAIISLLNKFPVYALGRIVRFASLQLEIGNGKITGYKRRNPHTDR